MILSERFCERFFFSWTALVLFGVAAVLSCGLIILRHVDVHLNELSRPAFEGLSLLGSVVAMGVASLLMGMWFFWLKCDPSSKRVRTLWFFILLLGLFYGAILYYLAVYLPNVYKMLREVKGTQHV